VFRASLIYSLLVLCLFLTKTETNIFKFKYFYLRDRLITHIHNNNNLISISFLFFLNLILLDSFITGNRSSLACSLALCIYSPPASALAYFHLHALPVLGPLLLSPQCRCVFDALFKCTSWNSVGSFVCRTGYFISAFFSKNPVSSPFRNKNFSHWELWICRNSLAVTFHRFVRPLFYACLLSRTVTLGLYQRHDISNKIFNIETLTAFGWQERALSAVLFLPCSDHACMLDSCPRARASETIVVRSY